MYSGFVCGVGYWGKSCKIWKTTQKMPQLTRQRCWQNYHTAHAFASSLHKRLDYKGILVILQNYLFPTVLWKEQGKRYKSPELYHPKLVYTCIIAVKVA